ncbi:hypothetical protein DRQ53_02275 [bacterium]|nr:MAG: hypothetical protein DRQ53_02275 [bacterium]
MTSLILANALCILLVGGLRFGPSAVLVGAPAALWIPLMAVLAGSLLVALRREVARHQAPWQCRTRILLWLIFPGAAALNWSVGSQRQIAGADLPALALLLGLVIAVLARRWPEWGGRELSRAGWGIAARWVLLPTLAVVIWGLTRGAADGDTPISLATYPIFALAQLAAALVLPWTQWARDGVSSGRRVTGSTLLFALAHWPNPFAIMVTAAGMFVWGMAWRRGSALLPLALSMGLTATVITQTLPDDLTAHMRVGASYALKEEQFARSRSSTRRRGRFRSRPRGRAKRILLRGSAAWLRLSPAMLPHLSSPMLPRSNYAGCIASLLCAGSSTRASSGGVTKAPLIWRSANSTFLNHPSCLSTTPTRPTPVSSMRATHSAMMSSSSSPTSDCMGAVVVNASTVTGQHRSRHARAQPSFGDCSKATSTVTHCATGTRASAGP